MASAAVLRKALTPRQTICRAIGSSLERLPATVQPITRSFSRIPDRDSRVLRVSELHYEDDLIPTYRTVLHPDEIPEPEFEIPAREIREAIDTMDISEQSMEDPLFKKSLLPMITPHGFTTDYTALFKFGLDDPENVSMLPAADLDEEVISGGVVSYALAHDWDLEALCLDMYRLGEFIELNEEVFNYLTGKVGEEGREDLVERIIDYLGLGENTGDILRYMSSRHSRIRFTTIFPILQNHLRPHTRMDVVQVLCAEALLPEQCVRLENNILQLLSFGTPGNSLAVDYHVLNDVKTGFQMIVNGSASINFRPDEHMSIFKQQCIRDRITLFREARDLGPLSRVKTMWDVPKSKEEWLKGGRGKPDWPMVYKVGDKWLNPKIGPQ